MFLKKLVVLTLFLGLSHNSWSADEINPQPSLGSYAKTQKTILKAVDISKTDFGYASAVMRLTYEKTNSVSTSDYSLVEAGYAGAAKVRMGFLTIMKELAKRYDLEKLHDGKISVVQGQQPHVNISSPAALGGGQYKLEINPDNQNNLSAFQVPAHYYNTDKYRNSHYYSRLSESLTPLVGRGLDKIKQVYSSETVDYGKNISNMDCRFLNNHNTLECGLRVAVVYCEGEEGCTVPNSIKTPQACSDIDLTLDCVTIRSNQSVILR